MESESEHQPEEDPSSGARDGVQPVAMATHTPQDSR